MFRRIVIIIGLGIIAAIWLNGGFDKFLFEKETTTPVVDKKVPVLEKQAGLPKEVEDKRQAIFVAAQTRDYEKLAALANEQFTYSYGSPRDGGFAEYLRIASENEKISVFDLIPKLLQMPYSSVDGIYAWPAVALKSSDQWTDADIAQMKTLFTDEEIEGYRNFGAYVYYRLGIKSDGSWIYYVAGD